MHWLQLSKDRWELIKNIAALAGAMLAVGAALAKMVGWARPRWRTWRDRKTLRQRVGAELYDAEEIRGATTYYIRPIARASTRVGAKTSVGSSLPVRPYSAQ